MVSIDVFAFVLTGLGLAASILYYANMLANANKTRKAQLFLNIYNVTLDEAMNNKWYEAMTANLKDVIQPHEGLQWKETKKSL